MKFYLQQSFSIAESSVCEGVSDSTTSTSSAYCALYKDKVTAMLKTKNDRIRPIL